MNMRNETSRIALAGLWWLLAGALCTAATEEFVGPFAPWHNVKTDFGAVGDGQTDDTAALQRALDSLALVNEPGTNHLWIPAGTYRITRTLTLTRRAGIGVLGEHPDTTIIRWDGPAYDGKEGVPPYNSEEWKAWDGRHPAEMLWLNARSSRIGRVTFDGAGKADVPAAAFAGFLPNRNRKVFPVASGADAAAIQAAIDAAVAHVTANPGSRPVVHLPWGEYRIDRTLVVPAHAPIQIVGDNFYRDWRGTMLMWSGPPDPEHAVVLRLAGPSQATLRNLGVVGPKPSKPFRDGPLRTNVVAACIRVENTDQPGARVFLQECNTDGNGIGLLVDRLDHAVVECRAQEGAGFGHGWRREWDAATIDRDPFWPYPAIRAVGGPKTQRGETASGGVWVFGTDTGRFQAREGARLLVRDTWYENN